MQDGVATSSPSASMEPRGPDICLNIGLHEGLLRKSLYSALTEAAEGFLAGKKRLRILDMGCGRGELVAVLAARGHLVTGVDKDVECVARAARYGRCFVCGFDDLDRFFSPGEFDVIACSHVLEHVAAPIGALIRLRRLEAKGYVFAVPNPFRCARLARLLLGPSRPDHPNHLYAWGRPEFASVLRGAGFRVVRFHSDRVTINPCSGRTGAILTWLLQPLEVKILPKILPALSSSLIVSCVITGKPPR